MCVAFIGSEINTRFIRVKTQNASFYWKPANDQKDRKKRKQNKTKKQPKKTIQKNNLRQSALYSFLFLYFMFFLFFVRFFPLETPESQICIFPRKKRNTTEIKEAIKKQIAPEWFVFVFFVFSFFRTYVCFSCFFFLFSFFVFSIRLNIFNFPLNKGFSTS